MQLQRDVVTMPHYGGGRVVRVTDDEFDFSVIQSLSPQDDIYLYFEYKAGSIIKLKLEK